MSNIITTTQLQQKIGKISESIGEETYIVTNRGEGKIVLLPYFDGCDENIIDYVEDFEMKKNKKTLLKKYIESSESGLSKLKI